MKEVKQHHASPKDVQAIGGPKEQWHEAYMYKSQAFVLRHIIGVW